MSTVINFGGAGPKLHFAHANGYPPAAYLPLIERLTPHYHVLSQPARPLWPGHAPGEVSGWQPFVDDLLQERSMDYSPSELMTVNAARLLRDGDVVFVGVGLPNLACNLARRTHAPRLTMIYEAGVIGAQPARLPLSIGDPTLVSGAAGVCSMYEIFAFYLQRGLIDVGFLGGAQIDRFGNVNATVIGSYEHPKVRLPGSGGSAEIAAWAQRTYLLTPHQKRRFPARCDFITGAGYLGGRAERHARGLHGGPQAVVTDLGLLEPDEGGELRLTALHPGKTLDEARANTGWDLQAAPHLRVTEPPSADELRLLRDELDPEGIYLKAGA